MQGIGNRSWMAGVVLVGALVLAGCVSPRSPAPVEDRGTMGNGAPGMQSGTVQAPITTDANGKPLPGIENYGKPGYYAVRPGDTLRRIGTESGQRWQDIARWNDLENADQIEVGQVLRVVPPTAAGTAVASGTPAVNGVTTSPVTATTVTPAPATATTATKPTPGGDDDLGWIWPAAGTVVQGFDEAKNKKGVDIAGKRGEPVLAVADGQVVYAGAGLRGYGNLIIIKHNNTFLTAYAHNQTLLVKEDQKVQKGQKIAEMGDSQADRVMLHFEIRRDGKPVDPSRYLPPR